jgi:transposase
LVGLDVSQKLTSICVVDDTGRRLWRGQCHSEPEPIERAVRRHTGDDASIGIETGPMTPWLVHELRGRGLNVVCLEARHASAALKMQMSKIDQNDAEGLAQIMRTDACPAWRKGAARRHDDASVETISGVCSRCSGCCLGPCVAFRSINGLRHCSPIMESRAHAGKERPDVPTFDERARYRGRHRAGLREYG